MKNLVSGTNFDPDSLNALQKVTLRAVVMSFLFYGLVAIEGMIMRMVQVGPGAPIPDMFSHPDHYFSIMTVHPIVGIFGSTYQLVFGAFMFLVPYLTKKPLYSVKLANYVWLLITVGTALAWIAAFVWQYAPLYTLYWPLPADTAQFQVTGGIVFIIGVALIMIGTLGFIYNIYATIFARVGVHKDKTTKELLISGFGIDGMLNLWHKLTGRPPYSKEPALALPVVAIFRGTVDTFLDAIVILSAGILVLVYLIFDASGNPLSVASVDALLYKNYFWWGLDLVADGLVLIYVAGSWYLLATLITGQKLFMENVARAALMLELLVSWMVWSHHLLADQGQPEMMKLVSGEMVTAFELLTQGLALFITLVTLWKARPLKMTFELKYLLGGLVGFGLAVPAAIIQADMGMNRVLHNTQWIIGAHVHIALIVGLYMTLYSAVYVLWPIVTNNTKLYSHKLSSAHFWLHLIGGIGMGAFMGMAGLDGMLRRHLYVNGEFDTWMILAAICGSMLLIAWALFLLNIIMSVGLKGLIGIFMPAKDPTASYGIDQEIEPADDPAFAQ
ncbi:cbb3-type cytochrome c oxidase subunit I [Sulfurovum sp. NBC37-1]|uniref:cbb3-type cytochrome c oxidase subunit I n=1 Tax=Sulfurovum sp. (strain NBC37-1) TaxID=387093 RepID=UPI001E64A9F6|nr:cbb3-type cytochrome c oxidase subunit I [Sulfurovum sp. NBC37-1]